MFDTLGIISFLGIIVAAVALFFSIFRRRMNRKLWIIILVLCNILLISSYYLDMAFDKEEEIKIDFTGVELDPTPTPKPTKKPTPVPTATPEAATATPFEEPTELPTPETEIESTAPVSEETNMPEEE